MNPFDLRGPEFLVFYTVFAVAAIGVQVWLQRRMDPDGPPPGRLTDPYRIAYLRGGAPEALRVATNGLLRRGLLGGQGSKLAAVAGARSEHPLEQEVLAHFATPREARSLLERTGLAGHDRRALEEARLLPDARLRARRRNLGLIVGAAVGGVAVVKVLVALSRGRSNIEHLVLLACLAIGAVAIVAQSRTTRRGREVRADMRRLFAGLKRSKSERSADATYCDAVYGAEVAGDSAFGGGSSCDSGGSCGGGSGCGGCGS